MKREIIAINENGVISIPSHVQMRDFEIAKLFEVTLPTIRSHIKAILKSGIANGDTSCGGTLMGNQIVPDYFELDMITTIAFRVQSPKAQMFRTWVISQIKRHNSLKYQQPIVVQIGKNTFLN